MWLDMTAIASYLPFCDAMFVDKECHQLLSERPLAERVSGAGRVFSMRNAGEFLEWIKKLETEAGPEHTDTVVEVYGEGWLTPFRTLLEKERRDKRRTRDGTE